MPFYFAFLLPVGIVLVCNLISFILVIRQIMKTGSRQVATTKSDKYSVRARLRAAVFLVILLGLTWAFALFAIGGASIVFHYLFALFNSLQGFAIFICYCCWKKEVRQCWRQACPCVKSVYEKGISKNTDTKGAYVLMVAFN